MHPSRLLPLTVLVLLLALASFRADAATATFSVGLDTDNNAATGCTLATANGPIGGIEQVVTAVVRTSTTGATVTRLERQMCAGSTLGAAVVYDHGAWPVGFGNGTGGNAVIELSLPLSLLGASGTMRAVVISGDGASGQDATAVFALVVSPAAIAPIVPVPLSPWLILPLSMMLLVAAAWWRRRHPEQTAMLALLVLVAGSGLGWAATVIRDGNISDWSGIAPAITDASGDAPVNADIVAVFYQQDGANLYFRIDADVRIDAAGNLAPIVGAGANQTITLPATATLAGTATDDGLPNPPGALATTWSLFSGPPSGVVFGNPAALGTTATFAAPGLYVLQLSASDGALSAASTVQITVIDGPLTIAAVPDRTIGLGTRFQTVLVGRNGNGNDVLTYALTAAPPGATLSPAPLVDWMPTAAQLGSNTFTARVTDSAAHTATTTFHVTVVHTNQPPQLATQVNVILPVGTAFSRTLQASDPDAGDVLTFAQVSGPAGMSLTGAVLNWSTAGKVPGDYPVTVRVTDAAGLFDEKTFTVTLTQAPPPPVAKDDRYEVRLGQTLNVPAAGVLGNDLSLGGKPLSAIKLTDPDKGTLGAFRVDGGFTYTAPVTLPPAPGLNPVVSWRGVAVGNNRFALAADFDHNGVVDYVSSTFGDFRAWRGGDGAQLWQFDKSITTHADLSGCETYINSGQFALGDVTGAGDIYLFASVNCDTLGTAGQDDRYFAANVSQILPGGKVAAQWLSPRLSQPHPGAYATNASPTLPNPPVTPTYAASANGSVPTLAKLTAGGSTKLLTRFLADSAYGNYYDTPNSGHLAYAACRTITGLPADEGRACKATFVIDAATGAIDQVLTAPNPADEAHTPNNSPTKQNIPIVADLDGDGQVEIISGGDVWKLVSGVWTLAWQAQFDSTTPGLKKSFEPSSVAVVDLDGDGKAELIFHLAANGVQTGGVYIFDRQGTLLRKIPLATNVSGLLSVADVDGDGAPEILISGDSYLYAYRPDGSLLWAKMLPDITSDVVPAILPIGSTPHNSAAQFYVYDLDLDGVPEVIVQGTRRLFILNGRTGAELWSIDTESDGFFQPGNPLLVDADGDGHVDIIVHLSERWNCSTFGGPVTCLGNAMRISGGDHNWAPGPKVQNQLNFRTAASDGGAQILYDASVRRDFRQQIQQGTVIDPRIAQGTAFTYKANDGAADSPPATVVIDIKPPNRPPVITSTPPTGLLSVTPYTRRVYTITATDPDPGDTVHYEFVSSTFDTTYFPAPTVDPVTGGVDIYSGPCGSFGGACDFGRVLVIVAAVDSHGARTEQSFFVDITNISVTVPDVIGQLLPAARTAIEAASLTPLVVTEQFGLQPAGTVIGQDPLAGTANVPRSATVRLTVSKGPQPVVMPFDVGQQLAVASGILSSAGLTINVSTASSTTIPAGEIMTQSPVAGTELLPATALPVGLTVSAGGPLPAPIASIVLEPGPGPLLRLAGDALQYKAVAILTDGTSADVTLSAAWLSSQAGVATVDATGVAKAIGAGATSFSASLSGKTGQSTLNVVSRTLGDNTAPLALITTPVDGATVTGPVDIVGTASDANFLRYELAYALAGDTNFTLISEGTTAVTSGVLGKFDPTVLLNDLYTVRLKVFDRNENESVATRTVQLTGNRKVGLFSLTFNDLTIPMSGIPIAVSRTYDSRDKAQGDFGVGWRLSMQTLRLRANRVLGTGWLRTVSGPTVSLAPTSEHKVSVTLADGRVEEFDMIVSPTSNIGSLDFTNVTGFLPRPGTLGQLQALANNSLLIVNGGAQEELVDDATLNTYSPTLYRYTTAEGTQIEISPTAGVKKVVDLNGNAITFGPGGIIHSAGKSVTFTRDPQGRITQITDPMGNVQTYTYDGNGDLVTHTSATGGVSTYAYNRDHGLIQIRDATGNLAVRSEYEASGRLVAMIDAAGKRIEFAHNPAAQEELITDRLGSVYRLVYDERGNVLTSERAVTIEGLLVNAVTTTTYDGQDNATLAVDPDGQRIAATFAGVLPLTSSVDPAGLNLTTAMVYNARNDITNATDPGGRPFTFTYDANGNLTAASTPNAGSATVINNAQGRPIEQVDALGTRTAMTRDAAGRITRAEVFGPGPVLLRRVDTTWNGNGNKATETLYRTIDGVLTALTTQYVYDAANRMIAVTDPSGGVSRMEHDADGRMTAEVDPLGRRTIHTYNALGSHVRTTYPDGTFEATGYDFEGNEVAFTDRAGRTTTHAYDELKQRVSTTLPDGAVTRTIYSAGGRVTATIDARGNRSDYAFDTAGRQHSIALPAVANGPAGPPVRPQFAVALNLLGQPVSRTDPEGRVTTFQYDTNGRLIRTTQPDGSSTQQTWDALGRRTSVINEEGQVTAYSYDGLGRLVSVSGLAGNMTYTYDEAGNLVTQTDALGRITSFRHDALNRLIERKYPGGETEHWAYDAVGNPVARTDGQGRVITLVYDAMNRTTAKSLPGGVTIATTYLPDGQRATVTDLRGVTTFGYDSAGRMASVTHPNGETISYTHDANGNLLSLSAPAATLSYGYDALDRLTQVSAPEGQMQTAYDLVGNGVRRTAANGIVSDTIFDSRNRPTSMTHRTASGTTLQSYAVAWSPASRRSSVTELDGSVDTYSYDGRGRLVAETRTGSNAFSATHAYDPVGNRSQTVRNGTPTTFSYDVNDHLTTDGIATYGWDANGNLVSRTQGAAVTQYGYDPEDRLNTILGGGTSHQYAYDADGNRVRTTTASGTTRFLVDNANNTGLSQVLEERDGGGNLAARYSYGAGLLAMAHGGASSVALADPLGSVRALANAAGTITDNYQYDAYGSSVAAAGSTPNPYRYRGERLDESGLYHLRARQYDPTQGRFLSRDPFAGRIEAPESRHRYLYANADPVNFVDPTGTEGLISLSVAQGISNVVEEAYALGNIVTEGCNMYSRLSLVNNIILWGTLSASAVAAINGWGDLAGKTGITVAGISPAAFGDDVKKAKLTFSSQAFGDDVKKGNVSVFSGSSVAVSLKLANETGRAFTLSKKGFFGSASREFWSKSIHKCGLEIGKVALKGGLKSGANFDSGSITGVLSAEISFLDTFQYEYPILELGAEVKKGKHSWVDKAGGTSLNSP